MMRSAEDLLLQELTALDESHRIEAKQARQMELLEMKGAGSRTYYVPGQRFVAQSEVDLAARPDRNSHHPDPNTHHPTPDTHQLLATIPPLLAERIPPAGSKPRRDILRALIVDFCTWRPLSARELASILHGRGHKPLVRDYLPPMVQEKLLAYTIPEMENHPDQRYTVPADAKQSGESTL